MRLTPPLPELLIEERKIVGRGLSLARFRQYVPMIEEEARLCCCALAGVLTRGTDAAVL